MFKNESGRGPETGRFKTASTTCCFDIKRGIDQAEDFADMRLVIRCPAGRFCFKSCLLAHEDVLEGQCRRQKSSRSLGRRKSQSHGLRPQAHGSREMRGFNSLMGDIDKLMPDLVFDAAEPCSPVSPVRKIHNLLSGSGNVRQQVSKNPFGKQTGFDPAVRAGKEPVGFVQHSRCAALMALIVDKKVDGLLRLFILDRGMAAFRAESVSGSEQSSRTECRGSGSTADGRIAGRIWHPRARRSGIWTGSLCPSGAPGCCVCIPPAM